MHDIIISINDYDLPGVWEMAATEVFTGLKIIRNKLYFLNYYIFMVLTLTTCALKKSHLFFLGCSPSKINHTSALMCCSANWILKRQSIFACVDNVLMQHRQMPMSPVRKIPVLVAASVKMSHVSLCHQEIRLITICKVFSCSD